MSRSEGSAGKKVLSLSVLDRYIMRVMRPQRGTFVDQAAAEEIWDIVKVSEDERKLAGPETSEGFKDDFEKEFEFSPSQVDYLKRRCEALDREASVTPGMVGLFRKIRG